MTKEFDQLYESIIHEVLSGSNKRNKNSTNRLYSKNNPGMGRKGGRMRDLKHATPMPRQILKHAAHIRSVGQTMGNETGAETKKPGANPVYAKRGLRHMRNDSQRHIQKGNNPYSSNHFEKGTQLNLAKRREKLLKSVEPEELFK